MKPYILVHGKVSKIEEFEKKVADAIDEGYDFASALVTNNVDGELNLLQPMLWDEELDFDEEEFDLEEVSES